jgi:hypothetical protein
MTHDYEDILKIDDNLRRLITTEPDAFKYTHTTEYQDWIFSDRNMTV